MATHSVISLENNGLAWRVVGCLYIGLKMDNLGGKEMFQGSDNIYGFKLNLVMKPT